MKKLYAFIQILFNMLSRANKEIIRLRDCIDALTEEMNFWKKQFNDQKRSNEDLALFMKNILREQTEATEEERWQEAMNNKYFDPWEDDEDLWEEDQECFANEIQEQKDNEYLWWVENELFAPEFYDDCKTCDGWKNPESCCMCQMFREENNNYNA